MSSDTKLISLPQVRHEIKASFEELLNKDWNKIDYYGQGCYTRYFEYLLSIYHTLYDDNELDEKEYVLNNVGKIFFNGEEALAVYEFCYWFHELTEDIEYVDRITTPNEAYLEHPEWPKVWSWAGEIVKLMEENNKKYDIHASSDFMEYNSYKENYLELIEQENAKYAKSDKK